MVEDDEIIEDSEGEDFDGNQVVFPDIGRLSPGPGHLVEIDNDPQDVAWEVERAEEREELMRHCLTMNDQAWREAMETEQLSQVDLVPGYIPPPDYVVPGHPDPSSSSD